MHKEITGEKGGLMTVKYLIGFLIIAIFLSGNFVAANAQSTAKSEKKSAAKYQGTLSGEWQGKISDMGLSLDGTFSITISADGTVSGTFSGFESGTITGTVSPDGEINAEGSAGFSEWKGQIIVAEGRLSGSGTWKGYGGSGTWNSK